MSAYNVSFRIADQQSTYGSYPDRWASVNDAIQSLAVGRNYWKETTSFFVLEAREESSSVLARAINEASNFDPQRDLLIVVNLSARGYTVLGVNDDPDIQTIMALR